MSGTIAVKATIALFSRKKGQEKSLDFSYLEISEIKQRIAIEVRNRFEVDEYASTQ